ncbi:hypothetical protein TNCT_478621 [Trichonephila clavata]|uniref:Uncharacterized protein n=1 Tax=Trichonephila clavata TaxID=2740835 RepID=A0A8X6KMG4_TRICU|nr:hypothetical protein TNCT_478621 [Trichonephila clavata]
MWSKDEKKSMDATPGGMKATTKEDTVRNYNAFLTSPGVELQNYAKWKENTNAFGTISHESESNIIKLSESMFHFVLIIP